MKWQVYAKPHELELLQAAETDLQNAKERFTYIRGLIYDRCKYRRQKADDGNPRES